MRKFGIGLAAVAILLMVSTALTKPKMSSVTQSAERRIEMARSETNKTATNSNNQPVVVRVKGFSVKMMPSSSNQPMAPVSVRK